MSWFGLRFCKRGLATIMALVVLLVSVSAVAQAPNDEVEKQTHAVADVLSEPESPERTQKLASTIDEGLDFSYLASLALGEHWEARSEEEREEFMALLRRLLLANYEDRLAGHQLDEDYTVEFEEARVRGDRAIVAAEVEREDRREQVVYRLYRNDDQRWRIYDIVIDDISLEETYREGYVPIIDEHGWQGLIERMQRRVDQLDE